MRELFLCSYRLLTNIFNHHYEMSRHRNLDFKKVKAILVCFYNFFVLVVWLEFVVGRSGTWLNENIYSQKRYFTPQHSKFCVRFLTLFSEIFSWKIIVLMMKISEMEVNVTSVLPKVPKRNLKCILNAQYSFWIYSCRESLFWVN